MEIFVSLLRGERLLLSCVFPPFFCNWRFPKIGGFYPQNGWFISWKTRLKLMIWGYHYSWKHPTVASPCFFFHDIFFLNENSCESSVMKSLSLLGWEE